MSDSTFYSIDKLVEFGMGMAVANQMVAKMNRGIEQMIVPGERKYEIVQSKALYYAILEKNAAELFEPYGTIRFINMFPLVIRAILTGGTLIVDEFDASIHQSTLGYQPDV